MGRFLRDSSLRSFIKGSLVRLLSLVFTTCIISVLRKAFKMRFFTTVATFGLAAFALAQDATSSESSEVASTATGSAASSSATLTEEQQCVANCDDTDICCQAACVKV